MNTVTSRSIAYLPLDEVPATERNPKEHDLPAIITSLARFGMSAPMVRDERTGHLVIGNGRRQALTAIRDHQDGRDTPTIPAATWTEVDKLLKGNPPDGVDIEDGSWRVPVVTGWTSRDDDHAAAMVITDNKLTERGGWDERLLTEILEEIADADPDLLSVTGYDSDDLDDLLAEFREEQTFMPRGESDARWAETDEEYEDRAAVTASYADRHSSGALIEMILVFPVEEHNEAVSLIRRTRERDGDQTAAKIVLASLRAYAPPNEEDDPEDAAGPDAA